MHEHLLAAPRRLSAVPTAKLMAVEGGCGDERDKVRNGVVAASMRTRLSTRTCSTRRAWRWQCRPLFS